MEAARVYKEDIDRIDYSVHAPEFIVNFRLQVKLIMDLATFVFSDSSHESSFLKYLES